MILIKRVFFLCSLICLLGSCGEKAVYHIEGKLTNLEDETLYAVFESSDKKIVDTVQCNKPGAFEILQKESGFQTLTIFYHNKKNHITVYLEPSIKNIITGDALYPSLIQVKGGRINEKLSELKKGMAPLLKEQSILENSLDRRKENNDLTTGNSDALGKLSNINYVIEERIAAYIKKNPKEEASAVLIRDYFADTDNPKKMDELLDLLDPKLKDFYVVSELNLLSKKAQRTVVGAIAPEFKIKDIKGELISQDSFNNTYLLLAFTAPWCDICQSEESLLNEISRKYEEKKLRLLMIVLEESPEEARGFIKQDSIRWNLVADNEGEATSMVDLYNVSALPRYFLIDKERKIISKTENSLEIKQILERLIE